MRVRGARDECRRTTITVENRALQGTISGLCDKMAVARERYGKAKSMKLFGEIRRRGLLKVATAYLVVSWLTLEIGHALFNIFRSAPRWVAVDFRTFGGRFSPGAPRVLAGWFGAALQENTEAEHGHADRSKAANTHEGPWVAVVGAVALIAVAAAIGVRLEPERLTRIRTLVLEAYAAHDRPQGRCYSRTGRAQWL